MQKLLIPLAGLAEIAAMRTGQTLHRHSMLTKIYFCHLDQCQITTVLRLFSKSYPFVTFENLHRFDGPPPCAIYPCAATSIASPSGFVQMKSIMRLTAGGSSEGEGESRALVVRDRGGDDDDGAEEVRPIIQRDNGGGYELVLNTRNIKERMLVAARNTFTVDNFKAMWAHKHRPTVLMCFGGYYTASWVSYIMSMFGIWSAVGVLKKQIIKKMFESKGFGSKIITIELFSQSKKLLRH